MNKTLIKAIHMWKQQSLSFLIYLILLVAIMLSFVWFIVYHTGGTQFVYLHIMYIPIIIAAFLFGVKGGMITSLFAGILLGPFMPLDVANNVSQPVHAYLIRTASFMSIGALVGYLSMWLKEYLLRIHKVLDSISLVHTNTLKNYAKMVSSRDEQTSFHCERVAYNVLLIGREIGLNEQDIETLYWSGLLHDVGKIGISEKILLKPGKVTNEEFEEIKRHTIIGYELISSLSEEFHPVAVGIRSHHEKWNGHGYPDQLTGNEIPLYGRILAIADVFEALTCQRPYKKAWKPEDALNFILNQKGLDFDSDLVDIFEKLYHMEKL